MGNTGLLNKNLFSEPGDPAHVSPIRVEDDTLEETSLLLQPFSAEKEALKHNEVVSPGVFTLLHF